MVKRKKKKKIIKPLINESIIDLVRANLFPPAQ